MTIEITYILLVEDSPDYAAELAGALASGSSGVDIAVVSTLAEARNYLQRATPRLVLTELFLPDGRGTDLLPADSEKLEFPVIIMTSRGDEHQAVAAMKAGALDYLVKSPRMLEDLQHILSRALRDWEILVAHRLAEQALRESEERFRSFFESAAAGMAIIKPDGTPQRVNPAFCRLSGYSEVEALKKNVLEVTHPEDREETRRLYEEIATGRRRVLDQVKRYLCKDGSVLWGHATVAGIFADDGSLRGFSANVQDITELKAAEQALRESEERFRTVFDNAAAGMVILAPYGRFLDVNDAFCRFTGYSRDELLELDVLAITHPADRSRTVKNYRNLREGRTLAIQDQKRYLRSDGTIAWGLSSVAAVRGGAQHPLYHVGLVLDTTEAKQVQDQIRESKQMLQLVLDYIPQHVFWKDRDSVYRGCNKNFARLAGVERPQDLIGKTDYDLAWKKEEADLYRECDRRVMETDTPELHIIETNLQASGKQAWLDTNKIPLHDGDGQVIGVLGTFEDITERKAAEAALVQANRDLDAFVYTVTHDLRTPLTPIIGYADLLHQTCRDKLDPQSLEFLAEIGSQGRRMLALLEDLLALATVGQVDRPVEPVPLDQVVAEILLELGHLPAQANGAIRLHPLPAVRLPKTFLTQIFHNLVGNALRYGQREGQAIEIGGEEYPGLVRMFVRDHGQGIPAEEREQIFEVFYRGSSGRDLCGTGIGLATVQKIARLYGGRAWVEETPGGGCTFWVEVLAG